jgi:hypothetical protein
MTHRSVAARVRLEKESHPERFCSERACLWRTTARPCPRHSNPDVRVQDHGTLVLFRPLTEPATAWLTENVDPEALWWGGALVCEHRFARDLVAGLRAAGFRVDPR